MSELIPYDDWWKKFEADILAIQNPQPDFVMKHFVVGQHDTIEQQWAQCMLEMQNRAFNGQRAAINSRMLQRRIDRLTAKGTPDSLDKAELLKIDLMEQRLAELGNRREFESLERIRQEIGQSFTREQLDEAQSRYWHLRLARQAANDVATYGRVQVGNRDALRQAGLPCPGDSMSYVQSIQQRFLEAGKLRILIAIPTMIPRETINRDGLRCLDGWSVPATFEQKPYVIQGKAIDAAYTDAVLTAKNDGANYLLTVEDDQLIPPGAFERLWEVHQQAGPRSIVGAWYPQRKEPRTGAPIVIRNGKREYLADDGAVHEVHSLPMGMTLFPVAVFDEIPQPWFVTTDSLTQDSFFSQLARERGYKLLCDTSVRIKHVDRVSGSVYE